MLRLTGGEFRGRMIHTLAGNRTRPTQARLRQALFNSLQTLIPDATVLDLFAGSGALGLEALSRGASRIVFVEEAKPALRTIEKNVKELRVEERVQILGQKVDQAWNRLATSQAAPFDIVLADPPYAGEWEMRLLNEAPWDRLLKAGGVFCIEWGVQKSKVAELPEETAFLVKARERNYGDSVLTTYSLKERT